MVIYPRARTGIIVLVARHSLVSLLPNMEALMPSSADPEGNGDTISVDGTIALCGDLGVDPEDVALLALAYELKSPTPGEWARKGWVDGLKALGYVVYFF